VSHGRFDNPVIAALHGFFDIFRKQQFADRLTSDDKATGKRCLVTGVNSGLGFALAVELAGRGADVIGTTRRLQKETEEKIRSKSGGGKIEVRHLDLSKLDSIHSFVETLSREKVNMDITILNAGVALPKARKTDCGLEEMFMVNYLSNVILTRLMAGKGLIKRDNRNTGFKPRIIFISSDSHQGSSYIDYEEFGKYLDYGPSKGIANYSYFKLILNTYATELSRRLNKDRIEVGVNVICPGPVHSNIIKEAPWLLRLTLGAIFRIIFKSPEKAAMPVVYMAISKDYEGKTNEYLHMFNEKKMDPKIYIPEEGSKLWERSDELWRKVDPQYEKLNL
jgi:NAD(P)-dependent dehydrogenase (short-subunit alcohol dehydrogenase family)